MEKEQKKYLLKGDISGIQEFIFNVQSDGAAKTLKAKSYYVSVISELCFNYCYKKLKDVGMSVELIFSGGGNFFIQITGDEPDEEVNKLQQQLNNELLHDDISVVLTLANLDEKKFGDSWMALLQKSNKEKLRLYKGNDAVFEPYLHEEKEYEQNKERFAAYRGGKEHNDLYKNIADRMVKSKVIETALLGNLFSEGELDFENRLANKLPFWKNYNKLDEYKEYRKKNYGEDYQIRKDEDLIDFDAFGDFAAHRTGTNKLAILKMDVDNLGSVFSDRISSLDQAQKLSKQFQGFFDKTLFKIWWEQDEFKSNVYPIFVGGDDCFIVGAWDKVLPFAKAINDAFQENFGGEYSLSAGIVIVDPKHPVISLAELAEEALSDAKRKSNFNESFSKSEHKKNSISIFNEVFSWKEFDQILEVVNLVSPYLKNDRIELSILDKIRNSARGFHALQQRILLKDCVDVPRVWKLKYYLGKKTNDNNFRKMEDALFKPYQEALQSALMNKECINPAVFPVAARIIEFSTKKELNYGENNN